ncbi:hypothetical protein [Brachybacterium sp. SGAir0954]|uniref:hypothetical protein n=1 Tax=Brachybacterium sp. SGAir0954 TaxID=2571029 RepID=UPI0010F72BDD|nr:hypothetical protein [Brachybacterium sp. SGAir0954]
MATRVFAAIIDGQLAKPSAPNCSTSRDTTAQRLVLPLRDGLLDARSAGCQQRRAAATPTS